MNKHLDSPYLKGSSARGIFTNGRPGQAPFVNHAASRFSLSFGDSRSRSEITRDRMLRSADTAGIPASSLLEYRGRNRAVLRLSHRYSISDSELAYRGISS